MNEWDEIKQRLTPQALCNARGYEVNSAGFMACGGESTPSLKIYDDGWHCYRCSEGGDIFDLLSHIEGTMSAESLKICADLAGVDIERERTVTIERDFRDLEALQAALRGKGWHMDVKRSEFKYRELWELFKWVCLGNHLTNTEVMRQGCKEFGMSWQEKQNYHMTAAVGVLMYGVDFTGDFEPEDLRRKPIFYGADDFWEHTWRILGW